MSRRPHPRRRRASWPLVGAGLLAAGNGVVLMTAPRHVVTTYGLLMLGVSVGALAVVVAYARALSRVGASARTVVLLGGPCDGRLVLNRSSSVPDELWLAGTDGSISSYVLTTGGAGRVLRYRPPHPSRPTLGR